MYNWNFFPIVGFGQIAREHKSESDQTNVEKTVEKRKIGIDGFVDDDDDDDLDVAIVQSTKRSTVRDRCGWW